MYIAVKSTHWKSIFYVQLNNWYKRHNSSRSVWVTLQGKIFNILKTQRFGNGVSVQECHAQLEDSHSDLFTPPSPLISPSPHWFFSPTVSLSVPVFIIIILHLRRVFLAAHFCLWCHAAPILSLKACHRCRRLPGSSHRCRLLLFLFLPQRCSLLLLLCVTLHVGTPTFHFVKHPEKQSTWNLTLMLSKRTVQLSRAGFLTPTPLLMVACTCLYCLFMYNV